MKPMLLDTNVLLRFITGELADQAADVAKLMSAADAGQVKLAVLPMVLAEAVFVLTEFYEHSRREIADVLSHLISSPGFHSEEQERMLQALQLFGAGKLDFVDCYLAAASVRDGRTVVSFDRALAKLGGNTVRKPAECC